MAKHKLFCVPGTWEVVEAANSRPEITPAAEVGMLMGITNVLDRRVFDIVYVNYPASFGPIPRPTTTIHRQPNPNLWIKTRLGITRLGTPSRPAVSMDCRPELDNAPPARRR